MIIPLSWSGLVRCRWPLKALVLSGCLLPGPVAGYFFHGRALMADFEQAKARHEQVQRQWQGLAAETEGQDLQAHVRGLEVELAQRRGELFDDDGLSGLLSSLGRLGAGLSFEQVRVGDARIRPNFLELPVQLRVSGDYQSLQRFLVELAGVDRLVTLQALSLSGPNQSLPGPLSMQLQIQAYRAIAQLPLAEAVVPMTSEPRDPFAAVAAPMTDAVLLEQAAMVGYMRDRGGQIAVVQVGADVYPLREGDRLGAQRVVVIDEESVGLIAPEHLGGIARVLRLGALIEG